MRAPLSWLREYAELPPDVTGRDLAERLIAAGLEVESVEQPGAEISGDVLVGRVLSFVDEQHSNGKTIRWSNGRRRRGAAARHRLRCAQLRRGATSSSSPCPGRRFPAVSRSPPARPTATSATA